MTIFCIFFKWDNWIWWLGHFFGRLECWSTPKNIGQPINSAKDDFAFTFNKEKNIGYISSNRSGIDHIYSALPICNSQIATVKNSKTGVPLLILELLF
jgi:hypothetical protein